MANSTVGSVSPSWFVLEFDSYVNASDEFYRVALEYCDLIDRCAEYSPTDFLASARAVLPLLYFRATEPPPVESSDIEVGGNISHEVQCSATIEIVGWALLP